MSTLITSIAVATVVISNNPADGKTLTKERNILFDRETKSWRVYEKGEITGIHPRELELITSLDNARKDWAIKHGSKE